MVAIAILTVDARRHVHDMTHTNACPLSIGERRQILINRNIHLDKTLLLQRGKSSGHKHFRNRPPQMPIVWLHVWVGLIRDLSPDQHNDTIDSWVAHYIVIKSGYLLPSFHFKN